MEAPWPDCVESWLSTVCLLSRWTRRWQAALDQALLPHEMSAADLFVLWHTASAQPPGISQIEIARELSVSAAQVCQVVDVLQQRGWLVMVRRAEDRRRQCCSLTPAGREVLGRVLNGIAPLAQESLQTEFHCSAALPPFMAFDPRPGQERAA